MEVTESTPYLEQGRKTTMTMILDSRNAGMNFYDPDLKFWTAEIGMINAMNRENRSHSIMYNLCDI